MDSSLGLTLPYHQMLLQDEAKADKVHLKLPVSTCQQYSGSRCLHTVFLQTDAVPYEATITVHHLPARTSHSQSLSISANHPPTTPYRARTWFQLDTWTTQCNIISPSSQYTSTHSAEYRAGKLQSPKFCQLVDDACDNRRFDVAPTRQHGMTRAFEPPKCNGASLLTLYTLRVLHLSEYYGRRTQSSHGPLQSSRESRRPSLAAAVMSIVPFDSRNRLSIFQWPVSPCLLPPSRHCHWAT
ncbi:hypothetical protein J3F84DRAFT_389978 [Trichoderma pleuroticola]